MQGTVLPFPGSDLKAAATNVLRANDSGRYTLPSRTLYPHQWNWDSALASLGWADSTRRERGPSSRASPAHATRRG